MVGNETFRSGDPGSSSLSTIWPSTEENDFSTGTCLFTDCLSAEKTVISIEFSVCINVYALVEISRGTISPVVQSIYVSVRVDKNSSFQFARRTNPCSGSNTSNQNSSSKVIDSHQTCSQTSTSGCSISKRSGNIYNSDTSLSKRRKSGTAFTEESVGSVNTLLFTWATSAVIDACTSLVVSFQVHVIWAQALV